MRELVNCDRSSDISDVTTQESNEDEKEFDPEHMEDRFRVDRKKLEHMLQGIDGECTKAEKFFQQIMNETKALITWPSKLKIGAKSKKDPHIKISGKIDAVKEAKEKVMAILDTKSNRVTLKMDVPFTDHSHIIGKGGNSIKSVMFETNCHIHFPDSNRNNPTEKSNQVSIAGEPAGVEKARSRIRESLPLVFSFEIPVTGIFQPIPDPTSTIIQQIQQTYSLTVQFRQKPRMYMTTVIVRGSENQAKQVKEGTRSLIEHFCGTSGIPVSVTMTMEVAPQHHSHLLGRNNCNAKLIMQQTATTIQFPDPTPALLQPRKGTITIIGSIEGVYLAKQKLIGCLPLVLMFDMKDDQETDATFVSYLMEKYDVYISVKPKPKQPSRSVIVKGPERNTFRLYEVRRYLLGLQYTEAPIQTLIPPTYSLQHLPSTVNNCTEITGMFNNFGIVGQNSTLSTPNGISAIESRPASPLNLYSLIYPQMQDSFGSTASENLTLLNGYFADNGEKAPSICSSTTSTLSSPNPSPRQGSPVEPTLDLQSTYPSEKSKDNLDNHSASFAESLNHLQAYCRMATQNESLFSSLGNFGDNSELNEKQASGYERNSLYSSFFPVDYEEKRRLANKEGEGKRKNPEKNNWQWAENKLFALGKSSDSTLLWIDAKPLSQYKAVKPRKRSHSMHSSITPIIEDKDPWKDSNLQNGFHNRRPDLQFSCSNYMDNVRLPRATSLRHTDLSDLLNKLGLDKYVNVFQQQEIDLSTFLTMNDQELRELGISTFGARRKMLLAISELSKQKFAAAPGAERKLSNSSTSILEKNCSDACGSSLTNNHW